MFALLVPSCLEQAVNNLQQACIIRLVTRLFYNKSGTIFFCVGVVYSGEYDVCDVTLSVYPHRASLTNMPGHGGNRTYDRWNTSPILCQLSYAVRLVRVCDISELSLVPSISMSSISIQYSHDITRINTVDINTVMILMMFIFG